MGQQVLLKEEGRRRHDCKDSRTPERDLVLQKGLHERQETCWIKKNNFKEQSLNLMLMVWVLIYSFCDLSAVYLLLPEGLLSFTVMRIYRPLVSNRGSVLLNGSFSQ